MASFTDINNDSLIFNRNTLDDEITELEVSQRKNVSHIYGLYLESTIAKKKGELEEINAELTRRGIA